MVYQFNNKKAFKKAGLKILSALVLIALYFSIGIIFKPYETINQLESELELIRPPVKTQRINYQIRHKPTLALLSADYLTEVGENHVIKHYHEALLSQGWEFCCKIEFESKINYLYRKNEFTASLGNPVLKNGKIKYYLNLSYGLGGCSADCPNNQ